MKSIDTEELVPEMLRTIKMPSNLKKLGESLPKSNYEPLKLMSVDKTNFIQDLEKGRVKNKHLLSLTVIKPSGQARRKSIKGRPEASTEEGDSLKHPNSEQEVKPGENSTSLRNQGSILPLVARKKQVQMGSLEMKLKYLSKKRVEEQYNQATDSNPTIEDYRQRHASPDLLHKKYDQLLQQIKR